MQKIDFKGVVYSKHLCNPILGVAKTDTHWLCGMITGDMKDLWEGYPDIHKYPTAEEYLEDLLPYKFINGQSAMKFIPCSYSEACQKMLDSLQGTSFIWKVNETTLEFDLTEAIEKLKKGIKI